MSVCVCLIFCLSLTSYVCVDRHVAGLDKIIFHLDDA